jgi:hypothetical protein
VTKGLDLVVPIKRGYVEAMGAWSSLGGPLARIEAGQHLTPTSGLFGYAEARPSGVEAGAGWRWTW